MGNLLSTQCLMPAAETLEDIVDQVIEGVKSAWKKLKHFMRRAFPQICKLGRRSCEVAAALLALLAVAGLSIACGPSIIAALAVGAAGFAMVGALHKVVERWREITRNDPGVMTALQDMEAVAEALVADNKIAEAEQYILAQSPERARILGQAARDLKKANEVAKAEIGMKQRL